MLNFSKRAIIHHTLLREKNKVILLFLFVLFLAFSPSVDQFVRILPIGADQAFANEKSATFSDDDNDDEELPINEVLYTEGARMPSSRGVSLETVESAWKRLSAVTGFNAYVLYEDEDDINAYITQDDEGDFIVVVFRGLLNILRTEDEIAGVLAHEIGHGVNGHLAKAMGHDTGVVLAATILSHVFDVGELGDLAINLGADLMIQGYSREHEVEADDFGVEYSWKAGYSALSLHDSIMRMADAGQVTEPSGFNSHPPTERRMRRLREQAERWEKEDTARAARPNEQQSSNTYGVTAYVQTEKSSGATAFVPNERTRNLDPNASEDIAVISTYPLERGQQNTLEILHRNGLSNYNAGKYKEALAAFARGAAAYEENYLSNFWAAKAGQKIGDKKEMAYWIDRTLTINPEYKPAIKFKRTYLK